MYKRKSFHLFLVSMVGVALLDASCAKKDLYNPGNVDSSSVLLTDGGVVPEGFNWNSVRTVDVRVAVDDKFDGKYFYRIEIFDQDPSLSAAKLLAAGQAKQGQDFVNSLSVPTSVKYLYLRETSPLGTPALSMIEVGESSIITVGSATASSTAKASIMRTTAGSAALASGALKAEVVTSTVVAVPSDAVEISGNGSVSVASDKSYVIKSGVIFTGTIDANNGTSNAKIYVQGTWKNANYELNIGSNNGLTVVQGGAIELRNVTQNTTGGFTNYGTASLSNMTTTTNSLYANHGVINVDVADITNGSFVNFGVATIRSLTSTTGSTTIRNEGTLVVTTAKLTNATLEAVCHTTFGSLTTGGAKVSVANGALLSVDNLESGGTSFNLAASAILNVSTLAKFGSWANTMAGPASGQSLARLKKVDVKDQNMAITYSGNLEIACSNHTANEQYNTFYVVTSPARLVPYDKSTVAIASTNCNAGGNSNAGGTPVDQTVAEVILGTYSYAFEDAWPAKADYDMNDFVVDVAISKYQNSANKVTKVKLAAKIRSVGALARLAAAIQLDGILASNVKSVSYSKSDLTGVNIPLASNNVESGQRYAVVPICDDAHKAFGLSDIKFISTQDGSFQPVDVLITVEFTTPLDNFTYTNLNTFIIPGGSNKNMRSEVHMAGYKATDKINKELINYQTNQISNLSPNDPFKTINGDPWALCVPVSFKYPNEWKNINGVYPLFQSWAVSGGTQNTNWYVK